MILQIAFISGTCTCSYMADLHTCRSCLQCTCIQVHIYMSKFIFFNIVLADMFYLSNIMFDK